MLEAIVDGQAAPETMAQLAKGRMRTKLPELEKALTGVVRDHHRFLLAKQLAHMDFLNEHIAGLSAEIERRLHEMSQSQEPSSSNDDPETESETSQSETPQAPSFEQAVELLDTIPGVDKLTAQLIVAELGIDMSHFPTAKHAAAWAGLAPGNNESGGKRRSGSTKKGNRALRACPCKIICHDKNFSISRSRT